MPGTQKNLKILKKYFVEQNGVFHVCIWHAHPCVYTLRACPCTPNSLGLQVFSVGPVFRRPLKIRSWIFFSFGVRCSGVPKTPKNQILDFLYSLSWCSDVAFLIVGYRSGAPLVFQRPLNFPFQIFFLWQCSVFRCSEDP